MSGGMKQRDFDLQRRIGKQPQQLCFRCDFGWHEIQDRNPQWTNILVNGALFVHNENIFLFERGPSGKGGWNFYRHGRSSMYTGKQVDKAIACVPVYLCTCLYFYALSAWFRSHKISSMSSSPTLKRTKSGWTPAAS